MVLQARKDFFSPDILQFSVHLGILHTTAWHCTHVLACGSLQLSDFCLSRKLFPAFIIKAGYSQEWHVEHVLLNYDHSLYDYLFNWSRPPLILALFFIASFILTSFLHEMLEHSVPSSKSLTKVQNTSCKEGTPGSSLPFQQWIVPKYIPGIVQQCPSEKLP